jgi:hypothetical protein
MPIVAIHHKHTPSLSELAKLQKVLPEIVSRSVECTEEPYDGTLKPGDINVLVTASLAPTEDLDYLIEIKTRGTESRTANLQERADAVGSALEALGLRNVGVWIELHQAAWMQV